jgi:hypothetical protein
VPSFRWAPAGLILIAAMIIAAAAARAGGRVVRSRLTAATAVNLAIAVLTAAALVLTVAPETRPKALADNKDPAPAYASALGGNAALLIDNYRITTELPSFVGPGYPGEQLLLWTPRRQPFPYLENVGIFHAYFNMLPSRLPILSGADVRKLLLRKPAELLLINTSDKGFRRAMNNLAAWRPHRLRRATLRSGSLVLHVVLVRLGVYYHQPRAKGEQAARASFAARP